MDLVKCGEYEATSLSARKFSEADKLEEWVQQFLRGEGGNLGMADGLKLEPRIYHAPRLMELDVFKRICGPEQGLKWQIAETGFNARVSKIMARYEQGDWDMPPLIINLAHGEYELNDGNHR